MFLNILRVSASNVLNSVSGEWSQTQLLVLGVQLVFSIRSTDQKPELNLQPATRFTSLMNDLGRYLGFPWTVLQ